MDINTQIQMNTNSIKQALNVSLLQKTMHKDADSVASLMQTMEQSTSQVQSASMHIGRNLDVRA